METKNKAPVTQQELLANIRRLTSIVLDRLEEGSKEGTLDQAQMRLLGSIAMRSLWLWQDSLKEGRRRSRAAAKGRLEDEESVIEDLDELERKAVEN